MPREKITRRQKNISRLVRERKEIHKSKLKASYKGKARKVKGFTLIELMMIVAIIGVLAAVTIPPFLKYTKRSRTAEPMENLKKLHVGPASSYDTDTEGSSSRYVSPYLEVIESDETCDKDDDTEGEEEGDDADLEHLDKLRKQNRLLPAKVNQQKKIKRTMRQKSCAGATKE